MEKKLWVGMHSLEITLQRGRCLVISPPLKEKKFSKINPNVLSLHLHQMDRGKKIKEKIKIKTYFMAKIASLQLYPDESEMTSDRPQIRFWL